MQHLSQAYQPQRTLALPQAKAATMRRIFSYEHDSTGKRSFIVTTYKKFWQRYQEILPDHRHHYEIIQEGMPCHLYFGKAVCWTASCSTHKQPCLQAWMLAHYGSDEDRPRSIHECFMTLIRTLQMSKKMFVLTCL